jgi:DNA (cytosine-5)-methyltransferase 1
MIKIGGQFSGVGAFDFALDRLGIEYLNVYQAEWDKYARQTYLANHSTPEYYVEDVNDTPISEITKKYGSLDLAMFSPPCQSFSLAGKRTGKDDLKGRGVLFFNSLEFIEINKPRFFIFENVKGLLSADGGSTFGEWVRLLGGKSVNGNVVMFPENDSVPYHIYYQVLNAKNYGVPQNRERVFIVGIRDDKDNDFRFPKAFQLTKRLKDILESEVDEKYYLSETILKYFEKHKEEHKEKGNGFGFKPQEITSYHANALTTKYGTRQSDTYLIDKPIVAHNLSGGKWDKMHEQSRRVYDVEGVAPAMHTCGGGNLEPKIVAMRGRNPVNPKSRKSGLPTQQMIEVNENGTSNALTTVQKDNLLIEPKKDIHNCITQAIGRAGSSKEYLESINKISSNISENRIRKLTPTECFRLMDFPDSLVENARNVGISNSQLYKQAGNSIVVGVLTLIIKNLKLF